MHPFRRSTLSIAASLLLISGAISTSLFAQNDLSFEPYTVYVAQDEAHARCGPGGDYYQTDPLRHGQALEVYAETEDGWLGIRPPQDSFCWIPAETIEVDPAGDSGVIIEDGTKSWIGTHLGRARKSLWQVRLAKGEPVTILGKSEREGADGSQLWYRIVPPSGEYRWVHRDQIVDSSEALVATIRANSNGEDILFSEGGPTRVRVIQGGTDEASQQPVANGSSRRSQQSIANSGQSVLAQADNMEARATAPADNPALAQGGVQPADEEPVLEPAPAPAPRNVTEAMQQGGLLASVEFIGRPRLLEIGAAAQAPSPSDVASDENWVSGASRANISPTGFAVNPPSSIMQAAAQLAFDTTIQSPSIAQSSLQTPIVETRAITVSPERIAQIQAETRHADADQLSVILSRLMAAQATAAEVDPVAQAAHYLASSALDSLQAGRARMLAERAEQYRRVASRRDGVPIIENPAPTAPTVTTSIPGEQTLGTVPAGSSAEGYLVQVYSARTNSPPFALTDNSGKTVAYVTPMAGMNLRVHLNSKVTITGSQGFLTGLNTPHIMASQVTRTPE
jgi:hypothetical protein